MTRNEAHAKFERAEAALRTTLDAINANEIEMVAGAEMHWRKAALAAEILANYLDSVANASIVEPEPIENNTPLYGVGWRGNRWSA